MDTVLSRWQITSILSSLKGSRNIMWLPGRESYYRAFSLLSSCNKKERLSQRVCQHWNFSLTNWIWYSSFFSTPLTLVHRWKHKKTEGEKFGNWVWSPLALSVLFPFSLIFSMERQKLTIKWRRPSGSRAVNEGPKQAYQKGETRIWFTWCLRECRITWLYPIFLL